MNLASIFGGLSQGLAVTLGLTLGGAVVASLLALAAGFARLSPYRAVRAAASVYVEVFRGTSALVQLYWFYYVLPLLGLTLSPMLTGILVLGMNIGAYGAEVVRGAITSIDRGQFEAATALNLTSWQRMRYVIFPQALVRILPPAGNLLIELLKGTALVSLITLSDLTFRGMLMRAQTMQTLEVFGVLLVLYFLIGQAISLGIRLLERHITRGWHIGKPV